VDETEERVIIASCGDRKPIGPINHERSGHRGAFVWMQDGKRLAEMSYTVAGTRVIFDHTQLDDARFIRDDQANRSA